MKTRPIRLFAFLGLCCLLPTCSLQWDGKTFSAGVSGNAQDAAEIFHRGAEGQK